MVIGNRSIIECQDSQALSNHQSIKQIPREGFMNNKPKFKLILI